MVRGSQGHHRHGTRIHLIGNRRRAAFINNKLYYEGADIEVNGETWRLKAVFRRKVLLSRNDREFELRIAARLPNRQRRTSGRVSVTMTRTFFPCATAPRMMPSAVP